MKVTKRFFFILLYLCISSFVIAQDALTNAGNVVFVSYGTQMSISGNLNNLSNSSFINKGTLLLAGNISNYSNFNSSGVINIGANSTISGNSPISVGGSININSGATLSTSGLLTITSNSTTTGSVGTSAGNITGNVAVQRYIPEGRRAFRFISHPFSSNLSLSSLTDNIDITGTGGSPLTSTSSNAPSAYSYDNSIGNSSLSNDPGWVALSSTSVFNSKTGYRVLIRGSKGQTGSLTGGTYTPDPVTLDWTGTLNQGQQVFTLPYGGVNQTYSLIGNPYASPVDLSLISKGTNVNANFSVWNANVSTRGAYVTQAFTTPYILPSGAAFFAQTSANSNNTITFEEANKATGIPTSILRTNQQEDQLVLQLTDANNNYADQLTFYFDNNNKNYTANNDALWDAAKLTNPDANLYSISNDGQKLAIDRRPLTDNTIIPLGLIHSSTGSFRLSVEQLSTQNTDLYLNDTWLNTLTMLQANTKVNIAITSNTESQGNNRFQIMSKARQVLPVASNTFSIKLSPNPSKDMIIISFSNVEKANTTITITSSIGKTVQTIQLGNVQAGVQRIAVSKLAKGAYYVTLNNGTSKQTEKLMIQ